MINKTGSLPNFGRFKPSKALNPRTITPKKKTNIMTFPENVFPSEAVEPKTRTIVKTIPESFFPQPANTPPKSSIVQKVGDLFKAFLHK